MSWEKLASAKPFGTKKRFPKDSVRIYEPKQKHLHASKGNRIIAIALGSSVVSQSRLAGVKVGPYLDGNQLSIGPANDGWKVSNSCGSTLHTVKMNLPLRIARRFCNGESRVIVRPDITQEGFVILGDSL